MSLLLKLGIKDEASAKLEKFADNAKKSFTKATDNVKTLEKEVNNLEKDLKKAADIQHIAKLNLVLSKTKSRLKEVQTALEGATEPKEIKKLEAEFEKLNTKLKTTENGLDKAFKCRELKTLKTDLTAAKKKLSETGAEVKKADTKFKKYNKTLTASHTKTTKLTSSTKSMSGALKSAILAFGGFYILKRIASNVLETSNAFDSYRMTLVTLEKSHTAGAAAWERMLAFAEETPFTIVQVMDSYKQLRAFGIEPTVRMMTILGDTAAALGGSDTLGRIALVLGQISSQGKIFTQDLNQLSNAGINAAKVFSDALGITRKDIALLGEYGLTAADQINILTDAMEIQFGGEMERKQDTIMGQWERLRSIWQRFADAIMEAGLKDYIIDTLKNLGDRITALRDSGQLESWAKNIGEKLKILVDKTFEFIVGLDTIGKKAEFLTDKLNILRNMFRNVLTTVISVTVAIGAYKTATWLATRVIESACFWLGNMAVVGATLRMVLSSLSVVMASAFGIGAVMVFAVGMSYLVDWLLKGKEAQQDVNKGIDDFIPKLETAADKVDHYSSKIRELSNELKELHVLEGKSESSQKLQQIEKDIAKLHELMINAFSEHAAATYGRQVEILIKQRELLLQQVEVKEQSLKTSIEESETQRQIARNRVQYNNAIADGIRFIQQNQPKEIEGTTEEKVDAFYEKKINKLESLKGQLLDINEQREKNNEVLLTEADIERAQEEVRKQKDIAQSARVENEIEAQRRLQAAYDNLLNKHLTGAAQIKKQYENDLVSINELIKAYKKEGKVLSKIEIQLLKNAAIKRRDVGLANIYKKDNKALNDLMKTVEAFGFKTQSFGDSMAQSVNNAIISMQDLNEMFSQHIKIQEKLDAEKKKGIDTTKAQALLDEKYIQSQLTGYRQLFGTVSQLFKEGSEEREIFHKAEMAFAVAELAMSAKKMAMDAAGTVVAIANSAKRCVAWGVEAVAAAVAGVAGQATGDPYTAFARIAAMIALMGSVLAMAGKSFGGGGSSGGYTGGAQAKTTGTVLGDPTKSSESLQNSFALMEKYHAEDYHELVGIHNELIKLNRNITGLVSNIVRSFDSFEGEGRESEKLTGWAKAHEGFMDLNLKIKAWMDGFAGKFSAILCDTLTFGISKFIGKIAGKIGKALFGGDVKIKVTGAGIALGEGTVGGITEGEYPSVQAYYDIYKKTKGGAFRSTKRKRWTEYEDVEPDIERLFNKVYENISNMLVYLGEGFNYTAEDMAKVFAYEFGTVKLDLKGLTGEEISEKINAWISTMGDTAVEALFSEVVGKYQEIDEGLLETAMRLLAQKEILFSVFEMTNMVFDDTTTSVIDFSQELIALAEDFETLIESILTYYDKFFTEEEKYEDLLNNLTLTLSNLGVTLPPTRAAFRALVESLDLTTEAGKEAYVSLMEYAEVADEVYTHQEELIKGLLDSDLWSGLKSREIEVKNFINSLVSGAVDLINAVDDMGNSLFDVTAVVELFANNMATSLTYSVDGVMHTVDNVSEYLKYLSDYLQSLGMTAEDAATHIAKIIDALGELQMQNINDIIREHETADMSEYEKAKYTAETIGQKRGWDPNASFEDATAGWQAIQDYIDSMGGLDAALEAVGWTHDYWNDLVNDYADYLKALDTMSKAGKVPMAEYVNTLKSFSGSIYKFINETIVPETESLYDKVMRQGSCLSDFILSLPADFDFNSIALNDAVLATTQGIEEFGASLRSLIAYVEESIGALNSMFESNIETIKTDVMDQENKYNYYKDMAEQAFRNMQTAEDPEEIRKYAELASKYGMQAWGQMTPEQQKEHMADYVKFMTEAQEASVSKLEQLEDILTQQNTDFLNKLEALMNAAVDKIHDAGLLFYSAAEGAQSIFTPINPYTPNQVG